MQAGDDRLEIGGRVFSGLYDCLFVVGVDSADFRMVGLKLSIGFGSGGDIRLEIDGSRDMLDGVWYCAGRR